MASIDAAAAAARYGELARDYDQRWSFYIEATIRETLRRISLDPGERLLDVGCGTGVLLEVLSAQVPEARFSGIDPTPEMLKVARSRLASPVQLTEGEASHLPFGDGTFDLVVSTNAFHYFRNPEGALAEMARVLRPGGRLVITDWCHDYLACRLCGLWLRLFEHAYLRSYRVKECRSLVEGAGCRVVLGDRYRINWLWGMMTVVGRKSVPESVLPARPGS